MYPVLLDELVESVVLLLEVEEFLVEEGELFGEVLVLVAERLVQGD